MSRHRNGGHRHHGTRKIHLRHDHKHSKGFSSREEMAQASRESHVVQIVACIAAPVLGIAALVSADGKGFGLLFLGSCAVAIGAGLYRWFISYVYKIRE